ncbi:PAS domain S-box protein [Candidatus Villigracilis saccharophilus]|uniref:PAS domain-containing sensor histidine kinase n=1 Tax=Candidatus Villigracilis saccharophilus TaxID=3140684 RepID=UPI003134B31D|nr:PAS domain S-box protein [Anaerolineales bacterium]
MIKHSTSLKFILLITIGLFISEVASMGIIAFIPNISYLILSIIDATLLITFATPLLYYFSLRPTLTVISEREAEIVQRREVERQLRIQTTAVETAANGIIITNKDGNILWANQAFAQMSGYSVEEALGKSPNILNSGKHDSDFYKKLWETLLAGNIWHGEMVNRRKDGQLYVGEQTITPVFNSSGEIENFIAIQQDVTERRQAETALRASEKKFRTLLDWTYDWEIWTNLQDQVMYNSPSCERITGYHPDEFIADSGLLLKIVHPEDRDLFEAHVQKTHDDLSDSITIEYRILTRDGNERWIDHTCRPIFGVDNQYLGRRVSNRDITERKRIEQDIAERNAKEKVLVETIHSMQIDIARDLHDSIGQNIGFLRMTLDRLSDAESRKHADLQMEIQNMGKVADETYDLIRGMLAMLQSGNSVDPLSFFIRYAGHVAERSSFEMSVLSHGNSRQLASYQMRQLFYVFREALSNIEKYAKPCRASVEFTWTDIDLSLAISDNGQGFDINSVQSGDHYGLKFMRDRIERLNGTFSLDTQIGSGTNIKISIPYEK